MSIQPAIAPRTVRVADLDINYDIADFTAPWHEPRTILLHHGFARNLDYWRPWVPQLARDYRVLRFDARGCGRTTVPPPGSAFTLDMLVADAVGLLDALGIAQVHWGAEASGGIVGLAVALAHPERITSLTLVNTPFQLPQATNDLFVPAEVERHGLGHWARKTLTNRIQADKVPPGWVEWTIREYDATPAHVAIGHHDMFAAGNLYPELSRIAQPVLIMAGTQSAIATKDAMLAMQARIPNARLKLFEGFGQGIAFMLPEQCSAAMLEFLDELDRSRTA
ncbi:MAG: alpha/beta hydrolase [Burkholderiales bacterium]|nr:alpha/beta hydrolase [Burkholderiales bacterium]